nr:copper resistance protein crf1 [Quercus suber]
MGPDSTYLFNTKFPFHIRLGQGDEELIREGKRSDPALQGRLCTSDTQNLSLLERPIHPDPEPNHDFLTSVDPVGSDRLDLPSFHHYSSPIFRFSFFAIFLPSQTSSGSPRFACRGLPAAPPRLSCLKGHRVSGCTHTDRELHLVPKKGRPVTQCSHCRLERKKRSAHVSCQCGETDKLPHHSREKCIHLREAEERAKAGFHETSSSEERDVEHLTAVAEEQGCCCSHGGKCSCALLKKEPVKDDGLPHGPAVKPRLESTRSDGSITVFQNGHHKPVHRKNHAAHECGMPYKMPLPRAQTEQHFPRSERTSVDNLMLDTNLQYPSRIFGVSDGLSLNPERHSSRSEQPSPRNGSLDHGEMLTGDRGNLDLNSLGLMQTDQSIPGAQTEQFAYTPLEPMSGLADDNEFNPWHILPADESTSMPNNNPFGVWPTNHDLSLAQPALTAASSGTQSEVDEIPAMEDVYGALGMPVIQENPNFNLTHGPGGLVVAPSNRHSLPADFFSPSDVMPGVYGEWPEMTEDRSRMVDGKPKSPELPPSTVFSDPWQMPSAPRRSQTDMPVSRRPASQSLGASHAPPHDIMHQLFPEMDSMFEPTAVSSKSMTDPSTSSMEYVGPLDHGPDAVDFTNTLWSDGSMNVPADPFISASPPTPSFDLHQGFSPPDFNSTEWGVQ